MLRATRCLLILISGGIIDVHDAMISLNWAIDSNELALQAYVHYVHVDVDSIFILSAVLLASQVLGGGAWLT